MASPDHDLLSRAGSGDEDALAELLEKHGPIVRQRLAGQIPRRWQSLLSLDDVMQQAYTDAFRDLEQFAGEDEGSFKAWLTSLAKCNLDDALRMLKADKRGGRRRRIEPRAREDSSLALYELLAPTRSTPSQHAARREACAALERALQQLPEHYRRVVQMYDLEEHPVKEVARALKRNPGAVYMVRRRAHRRLHEFLGRTSKFFDT